MQWYRDLGNAALGKASVVVAIGNFDGFHLGHQQLIKTLKVRSEELSLKSTVITFEPHPQTYFQPDVRLSRLSSVREKLELLRDYGVERVIALRFNEQLASLSAEDFVRKYLVESLSASHVVVGYDFGFGAGRSGTAEDLQALGDTYGFGVSRVAAVSIDGEKIGSTRVREALKSGDLELAARLLGRPYAISGRVLHGDQRGRTWGFPTANLLVERHNPPLRGVFAVEVGGVEEGLLPGVANLGFRPTVGGDRLLLEVHLINFSGTFYGDRVRVIFRKRIRAETKFESFDALKDQIHKDTLAAAAWLTENPRTV
ncbi:MAG TPA: bifunctional riboflavin kinase/FAD synthetase [Gammaproteobacteria bacterium]|nr:bifunctional riboflavin kinase/FAD synthetase [Gammaproteobacteria bacterium]